MRGAIQRIGGCAVVVGALACVTAAPAPAMDVDTAGIGQACSTQLIGAAPGDSASCSFDSGPYATITVTNHSPAVTVGVRCSGPSGPTVAYEWSQTAALVTYDFGPWWPNTCVLTLTSPGGGTTATATGRSATPPIIIGPYPVP